MRLVVSQRMIKGNKCEGKGGGGWSTEEMDEKVSCFFVKDTEEMVSWRTMSQFEVDECWVRNARKMEKEVLDKYKVEDGKREAYNGGGALPSGDWFAEQEIPTTQMECRLLGKNFLLVQRVQSAAKTKHAVGLDSKGRNESSNKELTAMKDVIKKIKAKGRIDANNNSRVSELLAADCEKAWVHSGWEDIAKNRYD